MTDDRVKAEARAKEWLGSTLLPRHLTEVLQGPITDLILSERKDASGDIVPALKSWVEWLKKAPQGEIHKAGVQQGRDERNAEVNRVVREVCDGNAKRLRLRDEIERRLGLEK